jgi:hydroxymethylpyrimidine pyrophosphatase-like HAD family hydrolase
MRKEIKLVAFDLDGTLTQHKTPLGEENRAVLEELSKHYRLLMVGAGGAMRIFNQLQGFPIDVIGNYGLQQGVYNPETRVLDIVADVTLPCDRESVEARITALREKYGFTEYAGENVEFHASGCVTFPLLGTKARQEDKLAFDPDRSRRRAFYEEVVALFPEFTTFVGGSSSFDFAPLPYNKYYALDQYCKAHGIDHSEVAYASDDYGPGGNDESVYKGDFNFYKVDDYRDLRKILEDLL